MRVRESFLKRFREARIIILRSGPAHSPPHQNKVPSSSSSRFSGWRGGLLAATISLAICVVVELVLLIVALKLSSPVSGLGTLYFGSCDRVKKLSDYLLIVLNVIGTITIGTSNYVMQTLTAPSRRQIDKAHANGSFLDIGISSPSNIRQLGGRRRVMYFLLGASTVPIHLWLNSVVFASLQSNNYGVMIASQNFQEDRSWEDHPSLPNISLSGRFAYDLRTSAKNNKAKRLTPAECISTYSNNLQSSASNVILVTSQPSVPLATLPNTTGIDFIYQEMGPGHNETWTYSFKDFFDYSFVEATGDVSLTAKPSNITGFTYMSPGTTKYIAKGLCLQPNDTLESVHSLLGVFNAYDFRYWTIAEGIKYNFTDSRAVFTNQWDPSSWLCDTNSIMAGQTCSVSLASQNPKHWTVTWNNFTIDYCLSTFAEERCMLQYSLAILIIIFTCELVKLGCMLLALYTAVSKTQTAEYEPLATIGDAIASFLEVPDKMTEAMCLLGQQPIRRRISVINTLAWLLCYPDPYDDLLKAGSLEQKRKGQPHIFGPQALGWKASRCRWYNVPPKSQWALFSFL